MFIAINRVCIVLCPNDTKSAKELALVGSIVCIILMLLAYFGKIVFITKYSIEVLPILLLCLSSGFESLKKTGNVLLSIFISIHLFSFFTPFYVTKILRTEGHRIPAEIIKAKNPENVIFTYYSPERFLRYIDLNGKKVSHISKVNRFEYIDEPQKRFQNKK